MHPNLRETAGFDPLPDPRVRLDNYLYTVLKHRWVVVATALATWLVAFLATFLQPKKYDASVLIQVDWGKIRIVDDVLTEGDRAGSTNLYATQEKILRSRVLLQRTVEELGLWEHPMFRATEGPESAGSGTATASREITRALEPMLHVLQIRNTQLMEVRFQTPSPELSVRLADELVRQYVLFNAEAESDVARDTSSFIRDQIEGLRRDILENERFLREYSRQSDVILAESRKDDIAYQRLEELNRELTIAESERAEAEALYASVRGSEPLALAEVRNSPAVRELQSKIARLEEEYVRLASKFKDDWPEVKRLETVLEEARRGLRAETAAESAKVVGGARLAFDAARRRERLVQESLQRQKQEVQNRERMAAEYEQVRAELANQRDMLQGLLRRRSETDLNADLGERQPVKVRVVEPAEAPAWASSPNVPMNLGVGFVLGLLLGVGAAFLLEHFDDAVCTVEDLRRWVPLTYLGMIPRYQASSSARSSSSVWLSRENGSRRLAAGTAAPVRRRVSVPSFGAASSSSINSGKILAERMRFLRGSLLLSTPGRAPRTILITSPDQSCGKTFVSCNLAAALIQLNKTVLLVDADLRNPNIHKVFRYRNRTGLTSVLTGQRPLREGCVMRTDTPNLFLLMAGPKSPNPSELLSSPAMLQALETCGQHFDFVLLDSAPLLPVFDTHALSSKCDAVVLVARAGVTSRQAVNSSAELVRRVNGTITGVVLNDVDLADYAQHYYYSNPQSYEYGASFEIPMPVKGAAAPGPTPRTSR